VSARTELPRAAVIATIKRKRPVYTAKVGAKSGFELEPDWHELSYVVTAATHRDRGISKDIRSKLLARFTPKPLFATTLSSYVKNSLKEAGFRQKGSEWKGKKGQLTLWLLA
jgi:hypothetical protein